MICFINFLYFSIKSYVVGKCIQYLESHRPLNHVGFPLRGDPNNIEKMLL